MALFRFFGGRESVVAWLFMLPFLVSFGTFFVYAGIRALWFAFTDYNLFNEPSLVGLRNFVDLLQDPMFGFALRNSITFSIFVTISQTVLALALAIFANTISRNSGIVRTIFYFPSIMSSAAITLIFLWFFQKNGLMSDFVQMLVNQRWNLMGFVLVIAIVQIVQVIWARRSFAGVEWFDPYFLMISAAVSAGSIFCANLLGLVPVDDQDIRVNWLNTRQTFLFMPRTLWSVALLNIFTTIPTLMLLFLAGLQSIPKHLYEAAKIDGANGFQRLLNVTLPALQPVTFAVVTFGIIGTLQMYDQVAIIGEAAPLESRITLAFYTYNNAFPPGGIPQIGLASAGALALGALTIVIVFLQRWLGVGEHQA